MVSEGIEDFVETIVVGGDSEGIGGVKIAEEGVAGLEEVGKGGWVQTENCHHLRKRILTKK